MYNETEPHVVTGPVKEEKIKKVKQGRVWVRLLIIFALWMLQVVVLHPPVRTSQMDPQMYQSFQSSVSGYWWVLIAIAFLIAELRSGRQWYWIAGRTVLIGILGQALIIIGVGLVLGVISSNLEIVGNITTGWVLMYINLKRARI